MSAAPFLGVGLVGFFILGISVLFDGAFDFLHLDADNDLLGTTALSAAVAVFGLGTAGGLEAGWSDPIALAVGGAGGLLSWLLTGMLIKGFKKAQQPEGLWSEQRLVGATGVIVSGAPAGGTATMAFLHNGADEHIGVRADDALAKGDRVEVVAVLSPSLLKVAVVKQDVLPAERATPVIPPLTRRDG